MMVILILEFHPQRNQGSFMLGTNFKVRRIDKLFPATGETDGKVKVYHRRMR